MRNSNEMKELTLKEALVLSPIEKHILYNKFPSRLFLNIILIFLVTMQVTFVFDYTAAYPRQTERVFRYLFLDTTDDESLVMEMSSPLQLQQQLQQVENVFKNFDDYLFQEVDTNTSYFQLHAYYKSPARMKYTYDIDPNEGFVNPFNASDLSTIKSFLNEILMMEISVQNLQTQNYLDQTAENLCLNWTITLVYDLHEYTKISTTMNTESLLCTASVVIGSDASVGVSFIVLIIASISLVRMISRFLRIGKVFIEIKSAYINYVNHNAVKDLSKIELQKQELMDAAGANIEEKMEDYLHYQSWEDVPFSAKMSFFSGWFIFNTIGNIFQISSCIMLISTYFAPTTAQGFYIGEVTLGLSVFCSWLQLLQYLAFWKNLTLMTGAIQKASTSLMVFFSICVPVFIGAAILGYSLLWKYDKFTSVGMSMRSLFALTCGDIVHETFLDTWNEGFTSMIFLIVYIVLFYTAFANIFVAVIMEGYSKAEARKLIDNDDPLPTQDNLQVARKMSLEIPSRSKESRLYKGKPELQKHLSRELGNPKLSSNAKNTINLLLFQNEEAKEELEDLIKIKSVIETRNYDQKIRFFLDNLLKAQVTKIMKKISYYDLIFKRSLEPRHAEGSK